MHDFPGEDPEALTARRSDLPQVLQLLNSAVWVPAQLRLIPVSLTPVTRSSTYYVPDTVPDTTRKTVPEHWLTGF